MDLLGSSQLKNEKLQKIIPQYWETVADIAVVLGASLIVVVYATGCMH